MVTTKTKRFFGVIVSLKVKAADHALYRRQVVDQFGFDPHKGEDLERVREAALFGRDLGVEFDGIVEFQETYEPTGDAFGPVTTVRRLGHHRVVPV